MKKQQEVKLDRLVEKLNTTDFSDVRVNDQNKNTQVALLLKIGSLSSIYATFRPLLVLISNLWFLSKKRKIALKTFIQTLDILLEYNSPENS